MRIVITGATGFIGRALVNSLMKQGHDLTVLSRKTAKPGQIHGKIRHVVWNPDIDNQIIREIDGSDAVINLAGEPIVGKRWSKSQKEKILTSRVNATKTIAHSIERAKRKPRVLVNASAIGIYGERGNEDLHEDSSAGTDFLASACKAWEAHAIRVQDFGVRVVKIRIGIVLEKDGGALQKMLPPFKFFAGGWLGSGNQWMSWIHRDDLVKLIEFSIVNERVSGALNGTAPQPVTNKAFSMVLAQALNRPCLMPVPEFVLKILLGEMSVLLLGSAKVLPKKTQASGFQFQYPDIRSALAAILK